MRQTFLFSSICALLARGSRWPAGSIIDDSPLVVIYYENWAGWVRNFSPSHLERNILRKGMPVRNFVLNYAFYTWNYDECSLIATDQIDLQKGDKGGWTTDDWNIDAQESWETSKPAGGHLTAFMMLRSLYPHIKLIPSIGGWSRSNTYHDCLLNKMDHMVQSVVDEVVVWGWDGIDLDWEYPNCDKAPCGCQGEAVCLPSTGFSNKAGAGDWDRYKQFVKNVRAKFDEIESQVQRRLYITAAVGMNPKITDGNNDVWSTPMPWEWICGEDDMDWVNLMAYDYYGPWTAQTGPLAPLYPNPNVQGDQMSIDDSIGRILKRCSRPEKLTMGLATYGKAWQRVPNTGTVPGLWQTSTASNPVGGGTWEAGTVSYFDIKKNLLRECTRTWDDASKTPTLYCGNFPPGSDIPFDKTPVPRGQPNSFVSYEDGESWKVKMAYARSKGMAGAIVWAASDTGNGSSYAPDSTNDLFEGLFEGWFGQKMTLAASGSIARPPDAIKRWAEYPCPHVTGFPTGAATVDMSRCAGKTYNPSQKYLVVSPASSQNDVGKDKLLIHPLGGNASTSTTSTTSSSSTTTTTTSAPPLTTTSTTMSTTTLPPVTTTPSLTTSSTGTQECDCVCDPKPDRANLLAGCHSLIRATSAEYEDMCQRNCVYTLEREVCADLSSGEALAKCVARAFPYCVVA